MHFIDSDYAFMLLHKARHQEMVDRAEQHRLATIKNEVTRRVRSAVRAARPNNSR